LATIHVTYYNYFFQLPIGASFQWHWLRRQWASPPIHTYITLELPIIIANKVVRKGVHSHLARPGHKASWPVTDVEAERQGWCARLLLFLHHSAIYFHPPMACLLPFNQCVSVLDGLGEPSVYATWPALWPLSGAEAWPSEHLFVVEWTFSCAYMYRHRVNQHTIHWMAIMTQLWMNLSWVNIKFHLGNSFCNK
jgi:hypothetical protein